MASSRTAKAQSVPTAPPRSARASPAQPAHVGATCSSCLGSCDPMGVWLWAAEAAQTTRLATASRTITGSCPDRSSLTSCTRRNCRTCSRTLCRSSLYSACRSNMPFWKWQWSGARWRGPSRVRWRRWRARWLAACSISTCCSDLQEVVRSRRGVPEGDAGSERRGCARSVGRKRMPRRWARIACIEHRLGSANRPLLWQLGKDRQVQDPLTCDGRLDRRGYRRRDLIAGDDARAFRIAGLLRRRTRWATTVIGRTLVRRRTAGRRGRRRRLSRFSWDGPLAATRVLVGRYWRGARIVSRRLRLDCGIATRRGA